ncbi:MULTISPECIES: roadblock/LC7 domain-containing protein [Streptomyces]|uniref:Predicted regulator of Ras-like GTPase activity, Roadblock/LC7/MglB family n=3 Tax=Streptomyces TaxID=1883 RepID=A0A1I6VJ65_9ACTN|nr:MULTISPECIES: roadblock/LC7 domain-containing protein [Streptomyces]MCK1814415.1 roadblock/LC7 domain-containing protein [Streptomyces sp. XM4011]QKV67460.1 roadblock/LC7 domain-containing protein [Streptomyces harbinensis]UWM47744.1 roadblock/LC7 domain-containing protein [Streptomyces carpaticus]SFT13687.1 Predicted regulator of Ras-like GTPase activity, Roadblock/LC7/MglB family [Streptomyces harbinensis]
MALSTTLDWMLDDLVKRLPRVRHVLLLSSDGLVTSVSQGLKRNSAEHLAAVASGLHALAKGVGEHFRSGGVRQTMIEFDDGVLLVTAAGDGSCLCVLAGSDADIGQVGYEMTLLVNKVGEHMGLPARETP